MTTENVGNIRLRNNRLINEELKDLENLDPIIEYARERLVSLKDACLPLNNIVYQIFDYASLALEETQKSPPNGLTHDESAAIRLYTMEWTSDHPSLYSVLNSTLRKKNRHNLQPWSKYLKLFLTGLVKIPCAPVQAVWRGVRKNVRTTFPIGGEVIWWAFSSCTTKLTVLEDEVYLGKVGERTLFSIEVFNARNIKDHSHFKNEDEILLLPGTIMEVRSLLNPTNDLDIIHLRQKVPETRLLEPPFEGASIYPTINSMKNSWYRQKKYIVPISLVTVMCILGIVLGSIFGRRLVQNIIEHEPIKATDGICSTARWSHSGVTVAGGKGPGSDLDQLNSPDGLFIDNEDNIYVVDSGNNRVVKWKNGSLIVFCVACANSSRRNDNQLDYPLDVVIDGNGTMFITDFNNFRVLKWLLDANSGQTMLQNRQFIGIAVDHEGSLYTSDWTDNQIRKWKKDGSDASILSVGLNHPDRLFVNRNRSIYVADRDNHRIIKIVDETAENIVVAGGSQGESFDQLDYPRSVTVDKSNNVYVADTMNHRIMRWLPGATSGTVIVGGRSKGSRSDQLNTPTDLQFDKYGNLYVSDSQNNRIQKFLFDKASCL